MAERELIIDGKRIADDTDCYFIAEIGHNHGGSVKTCKEMFRVAKECGADAVKLQKRNNRKLYTKAMYDSPYENENSYGKTYGEHREALEFNKEQYIDLQTYAWQIGITFFATAFDPDSADFLNCLNMPAFKIASGDLTNIPLIDHIAGFGKPMIISTGGGQTVDLLRARENLKDGQFAFLHCIATYPSKPEEMNLSFIKTMRQMFSRVVIGLSDHYNGIVMAEAAYIMGARIIEKHFTLNHTWKGTDHALSLEPQGFESMVNNIKRLKLAIGNGDRPILPAEAGPIRKMAKAVHVNRFIPAGKQIDIDDIALKSPADGIPAYEYGNVLGKIALHDLSTANALTWEDVE